MEPFRMITGVAVPYLVDDINTDEITPVQRNLEQDFAELLFARRRRLADGSMDPDFPFNQPAYAGAAVVVAGRNFGCGSSRESAVWAMGAVGIRAIVARSFADLYHDNCLKNGLLPVVLGAEDAVAFEREVVAVGGTRPVTVDLERQLVLSPSGEAFRFEIDPGDRAALLEGLDDIGMSLREDAAITAFEQRVRTAFPWQAEIGQPANGPFS
jgi:3-isopropylmalate/(R)-2-methylmalate dehydratase small subunit